MIKPHIRPIHIVRANNYGAAEIFPPPIHHHQLRYDFPTAIGIPRIAWIGNQQRSGFVGGNGRGMVYFRARCEKYFRNSVQPAPVQDIEHPSYRDIEHRDRLLVEMPGAVYRREMDNKIDPLARGHDRLSVSNVAGHALNRGGDVSQPPSGAPREIVQYPDGRAARRKTTNDCCTDKPGSTGYEDAHRSHETRNDYQVYKRTEDRRFYK